MPIWQGLPAVGVDEQDGQDFNIGAARMLDNIIHPNYMDFLYLHLFRVRMSVVIGFFQSFGADMGVNLRGA